MKLSYRGLHYDYDPPTVDMMEGEAGGLYRGCQWQIRYPRHIPVTQPSRSLKYRAVAYSTPATAEDLDSDSALDRQISAEVKAMKKTGVFSNSKPQPTIWQEAAQIHQANICRSLQRRMNIAQAQGDRKLMNLLQQESQDLACSLF